MRSPGAHHASHAKAGRGCNGCSCTPRARPHGNPKRVEPCGLCPSHRRHRLPPVRLHLRARTHHDALRCARLPAGLAPSSTDDVHGAARPLRTQQFVIASSRIQQHAPSAQRGPARAVSNSRAFSSWTGALSQRLGPLGQTVSPSGRFALRSSAAQSCGRMRGAPAGRFAACFANGASSSCSGGALGLD